MLTVKNLLAALDGLDPDAQVVVGIINGPRFNAAYAQHEVCGIAVPLGQDRVELRGEGWALYICCYEEPRPGEGPRPEISGDGTATLRYDPGDETRTTGADGDQPPREA